LWLCLSGRETLPNGSQKLNFWSSKTWLLNNDGCEQEYWRLDV